MWQCLLGKITFLTGVPSLVLEDTVMIGEAEDKDSAPVCCGIKAVFSSALVTHMLIKALVLLSAVCAKSMLNFTSRSLSYVLVAAEQISKRVVRCK